MSKNVYFKPDGIEKLSFEYVPSRLPHREDKIEHLVKMLNTVLESSSALSQRPTKTRKNSTREGLSFTKR